MAYAWRNNNMANIDETIRYVDLLSLYGNLLSKTQKEVLEDYFSYNLSISEIAENRKISRAAVEDAIKKGKKKLEDSENKLGSLKVLQQIRTAIENTDDPQLAEQLQEMERMMKHGI